MFTVVMLSLLIILNDSFASVFEKFNPGQTFWFRSLKWKWLSQQKIPPNKNFIPLKFLQAYHFNRLSKPLLSKVVRFKWRLREFFGRKSTFFSSCILKDSPFSCDHFDGKVVVKGWPEAEKNRNNKPKISKNYHTFVTISMTSSLWVIP